jgi:hypothetical protein
MCTSLSLVQGKFIQLSLGFGNRVVRTKERFFFWLLLKDRLSTREHLKKEKNSLERLQLCSLSPGCGRNFDSPVLSLPFLCTLLGYSMIGYSQVPFFSWRLL